MTQPEAPQGSGKGRSAPRPPSGLADRSPAMLWQEWRASCPRNGTIGRYLWPRRHGTPAPRETSRGSGYSLNDRVPPTAHHIAYVEILTPRGDGTRRWGLQELLCPPEWDRPLLTSSREPLTPPATRGRREAGPHWTVTMRSLDLRHPAPEL